ncbi:MAG: hypothetical protein WCC30_16540 [Candidatus Dormiibacterota bacterium]
MRVGEFVFADLQLDGEVKADKVEDLPLGAVALHMFFKLSVTGDQISVAPLDEDWLRKQLADGKLTVAHEKFEEDGIVLTAPSPQLRIFLSQIGAKPEAFGDEMVFRRKK